MFVVSVAWIFFDPSMSLDTLFLWSPSDLLAIHLALGVSLAVFLHALTKELNAKAEWSRRLTIWFQSELGHINTSTIFVLALSSGIGEELLFRGVIQQKSGVLIASLLFGIMHWPPRKELRSWTYMAGIVGLLLGGITEVTSSIVPAMITHVLINFLNLRLIVRTRRL